MSTTSDFDAYDAKMAAFTKLTAEAMPHNRAALFDVLLASGIAMVVVTFDGAGDSGQIEAVDGFDSNDSLVDLPNTKVGIKHADFDSLTLLCEQSTVREIMETMAYELLEKSHDGWEIDDGGYGEFTFGVADRTINLAYNERYTETNYHEHEF